MVMYMNKKRIILFLILFVILILGGLLIYNNDDIFFFVHGDRFEYKSITYINATERDEDGNYFGEGTIRFLIFGSLSWDDSTGNSMVNCDDILYKYHKKTNIVDLFCNFKKFDEIKIIDINKSYFDFEHKGYNYHYRFYED